jgi:large subunit ribosomal protein L29
MKGEEITQLSENDIHEKLEEQRAVLTKMKFDHSVSGLENPIVIGEQRKIVARLMTELNSRKKNAQ